MTNCHILKDYTTPEKQNNEDRNFAIINAYLDGYSQVDIASYLKLSKSLISKVVKSGDSMHSCKV